MSNKPTRTLRRLDESELDTLYTTRIAPDFPRNERPSLAAMHTHMERSLQDIFIMTNGTEDEAYAVCAEANDIVLITLLAVFADKRGGGRGTALLGLLRAHYADRRALILEVEDPKDANSDDELATRSKRIAFYERNGYRFFSNISHVSFDVPLLLMALPLTDTFEAARSTALDDMHAVYRKILPEKHWPRVVTTEA